MLGQTQARMGAEQYGAEWQETVEAHAEWIVAERLRAETVVSVKWIAERLHMGAPGYVHHLSYRRRQAAGQRVANIKN